MHFMILLFALLSAVALRMMPLPEGGSWHQRWQKALFLFVCPPLVLLMTALAVLSMGAKGKMLGLQASWFSYLLALGVVGWGLFTGVQLLTQLWQSQQRIYTLSQQMVMGKTARILEDDFPYSAQVGFWQPELVVSRGLLKTLDDIHLEAVIAHEQAHLNYRDTFWFFALGWLQMLTVWLPNTEKLWQELLLLREMRADRYATQQVDPLILAESLLYLAKAPFKSPDYCNLSFSCSIRSSRLGERIDAILIGDSDALTWGWWRWMLLFCVCLPWVTVPFHYS
ncbi:Peptidase M48 Ste24p [Planktothrix serta PCC 8927]|uniref:Peptidase M48 Ste24p n=1 Tax=Planktothrix serta PCC 8927 TaxID=671068 RepID=A0A7Z9BIC9_9CYAN|nr:M56 family metallopeptidase [Planktothrix serta]VXD14769.1 Peptidase M48 Ste24p [Planktothrix serta PCC 8927]